MIQSRTWTLSSPSPRMGDSRDRDRLFHVSLDTNQRNTDSAVKEEQVSSEEEISQDWALGPPNGSRGRQAAGLLWAGVSPWQLKSPRLCCNQQRIMRGLKMAGDTIRGGRRQGWGLK